MQHEIKKYNFRFDKLLIFDYRSNMNEINKGVNMFSDKELDLKTKRLNTFSNSKQKALVEKWVAMSDNEKLNYVVELIEKGK